MANTQRWRYGEVNPRICEVYADAVIEIGDLVYANRRGQVISFQYLEEAELAVWEFAGVAAECANLGLANRGRKQIRIHTSGVFEFALDACCTVQCSDWLSPVANQTVCVGTELDAIGRCALRTQPEGKVLIDIYSEVEVGVPFVSEFAG